MSASCIVSFRSVYRNALPRDLSQRARTLSNKDVQSIHYAHSERQLGQETLHKASVAQHTASVDPKAVENQRRWRAGDGRQQRAVESDSRSRYSRTPLSPKAVLDDLRAQAPSQIRSIKSKPEAKTRPPSNPRRAILASTKEPHSSKPVQDRGLDRLTTVHSQAPAVSNQYDQTASTIITRAERAMERHDGRLAEKLLSFVIDHEAKHDRALPQPVYASLFRMFLTLRRLHLALQVLRIMQDNGHEVDKKMWTTAMRQSFGLKDARAVDLFWEAMISQGITPDAHAWSARIFALINAGRPEAAIQALEQTSHVRDSNGKDDAIVLQPSKTIEVANSALSALASKKEYETYIPAVLTWIEQQALQPDVRTYNILINVAMRRQSSTEAFRILDAMRESGIAPDGATATVLMTAFFHTHPFQGDTEAEAADRLLQTLDDVEDVQVLHPMSSKGYATVLHEMVKRSNNIACQALIQRMRSKDVPFTSHIYTILMDLYLGQNPPDYDAFDSLWTSMKFGSNGWEVVLDHMFYQRALERLAHHHEVLGLDKLIWLQQRMVERKFQPSWPALHSVARAYYERGDRARLAQLIDDIQQHRGIAAAGFASAFGQGYFWKFVFETGVVTRSDVSDTAQLRHEQARFNSGEHAFERGANMPPLSA